MSYRVETATTGRSGCNETECKKNQIKIERGDLRFGVWVEYPEHGGWAYRHWGCVTGAQLKNVREYLADPDTGEYRWDALDGYDSQGAEKNSLEKFPDLQEKVRRVVTQGFIDPEDWNGDPEMNKLGEKGTRTKESVKKIRDEARSLKNEWKELDQQKKALMAELAALRAAGGSTSNLDASLANLEGMLEANSVQANEHTKVTPKKRVRAEGDDEETVKPAKKKRASKANKEVDSEEEAKPAKKRRAPKAKKEESEDFNDILVKVENDELKEKLKRAKKEPREKSTKKEESDDEVLYKTQPKFEEDELPQNPQPTKKGRTKKPIKKELDDDTTEDAAEIMPAPSKRSQAKNRALKNEVAVKEELNDIDAGHAPPKENIRNKRGVKKEEDGDDAIIIVKKEPAKRKGRKMANAKTEPIDEADDKGLVLASLNSVGINGMKGEPSEVVNSMQNVPDIKAENLKSESVKVEGLKDEEDDRDPIMKNEDEDVKDADLVGNSKKPTRRAKKEKAAATPPASTRASRTRTSSRK